MSAMEISFGNRAAKSTRLLFFPFSLFLLYLSSLFVFRRVCEKSLVDLSFPSACLCVRPTGQISMKFYIEDFYENLPTDSSFG